MNELFLNSGVRGMLEVNNYHEVDIAITFIGAILDRTIGFLNDENMTGVHRMYSDVVSEVVSLNNDQERLAIHLENYTEVIVRLKTLL